MTTKALQQIVKDFKSNSTLMSYLKKVYRDYMKAIYIENNLAVVTDNCFLYVAELEDKIEIETPKLISLIDTNIEYDYKLYPNWRMVIPQDYNIKFSLLYWNRLKTFLDAFKIKYSPEANLRFTFKRKINAPIAITKIKLFDTILTIDNPFEIGQVQEIKDNVEDDNNEFHFYIQLGYVKLMLSFFRPATLLYSNFLSCLTFAENDNSITKFLVMPVDDNY